MNESRLSVQFPALPQGADAQSSISSRHVSPVYLVSQAHRYPVAELRSLMHCPFPQSPGSLNTSHTSTGTSHMEPVRKGGHTQLPSSHRKGYSHDIYSELV